MGAFQVKSLWGYGLSLVAATQRLPATPRPATAARLNETDRRAKTKGSVHYFGLSLTVLMAAWYPFSAGEHHLYFVALVLLAIGIGGYPIIDGAVRDLFQKRVGTVFCVSLALFISVVIGDHSVALNLVMFVLLTQTVEDWTIRQGAQLPPLERRERGPFGATPNARSGLTMFESNTVSRLERVFVYLSLTAAVFTLLITSEMRSALAVLIVGSASALSVGMYLVAFGCTNQAVSHGLLIRKPRFMERLAAVDVAVLDEPDKTGATFARDLPGVEIHASDTTRMAIESLRTMKVETVLFTGGSQRYGQALGQRLGVNAVEAELFSDDKPFKIAGLQRRHRKVVFLGNEASGGSSLAVADVGILTGAESPTPDSDPDAILLTEDLTQFAEVIRIARRARRIAAVSFALAVIVAAAGIGVAMQGKISPQTAVAARFGLELALMLGASRMLVPLLNVRAPERN